MRALFSLLALLPVTLLQAAEIPLYPTGPSEDSAFLRFFNAGQTALELSAANGASLRLEGDVRASDLLAVPAGTPLKGTRKQANRPQQLGINVAPGVFATVVRIPSQQGLELVTVREEPDDFNALKASLAFYSLDASCTNAGLQAAGRNIDIFKDVAHGALQRRSINPLSLSVQLRCAGASVGEPLALGELAAGQRYTLFPVPSADGPRLFQALDNLAN